MVDTAEKEKAEKLAAAKKRFEQLKKQKDKGKKTGENATEKNKAEEKPTNDNTVLPSTQDEEAISSADAPIATKDLDQKDGTEIIGDTDTALDPETPSRPSHGRQPSLSLQSRMRSSSFRRTSVPQTPLSPTTNGSKPLSLPALSPDGDAVTEIYRKQAFRLDELEKENKKLTKEVEIANNRWQKTEEELEELRENSGQLAELKLRAEKADARAEEVNRLKSEIISLQRQNSHLQSLSSRNPRHANSPSQANEASDLLMQLDSKSLTIETMEIEISNLRAELDKRASSTDSHVEQVTALEEKLERAERAAGAAQRELLDLRKNLDRASEKAVREGSERTSAETQIRSLSREAEATAKAAEESMKRVETLEKKLAALTTLYKESDTRRHNGDREREKAEKEVVELRKRMAVVENENLKLQEERERLRKKAIGGESDNDGLDELEDEERKRLEGKIRDLEGEVFDLRKGIWREKRKELQKGEEDGVGSPGGFDEVDLSGPTGPIRRQSLKMGRGQGFANVLSSGFSAFTGGGERGSLDLVDDEDAFDEDAFRRAQEDEAKMRLERVKEVKRRLKDWEGWRMDIADSRIGGGGVGEIFDV